MPGRNWRENIPWLGAAIAAVASVVIVVALYRSDDGNDDAVATPPESRLSPTIEVQTGLVA